MAVRCPRCGRESTGAEYCGACGASLQEATWVPRPAARRRVIANTPFAVALVIVHAAAWLLIASSESIWRGLGFACAAAFLCGLLAGALRVMDPMDPEAFGEPVGMDPMLMRMGQVPFLLYALNPRMREKVPVLVLSLLFALVATPVAGLLVYLIFGYAKACTDSRVVALYGLVIVSALVLSLPAPAPLALTFRLYSTLMLPAIMLGWALSSFFRSGAW